MEPENDIKLAKTQEEKEAIYRFRYEVYIDEMGKTLESADHKEGRISDELDEDGLLFYSEVDGKIAMTIRMNILSDCTISKFLIKNYALDKIGDLKDSVSLTSKLMVSPELRNSTLLSGLLFFVFNYARTKKIKLDFCYCAPSLVQLYEHLGYRRYKSNFIDPEVGYRVPLVLMGEDVEHFKKVRSPFYILARKLPHDGTTTKEFFKHFSEEKEYLFSTFDHNEYFWDQLGGDFHNRELGLFKDLSQEEIDTILKSSSILKCQANDHVVRQGDVGNEMFFILNGAVEVSKDIEGKKCSLANFGKGQIFGEIAFLSEVQRTADVIALEEIEILIITQNYLEGIMKNHPAISVKLLYNLSKVLCERLSSSTRNWMQNVS